MTKLGSTICYAVKALDGQLDKQGLPAIFHSMRIILDATNDEERILAILHDVAEDTQLSVEQIATHLGLSKRLHIALYAITRQSGAHGKEDYDAYLVRVKNNELARKIKIIDLCDNISPSRQYKLSEPHQATLKEKYENALKFLLAEEEPKKDETLEQISDLAKELAEDVTKVTVDIAKAAAKTVVKYFPEGESVKKKFKEWFKGF